ncbi:Uncharacterised protein [Chlamydia trachomatis]|nr:Uncharacterised protein [Chlamydia trachomatis]
MLVTFVITPPLPSGIVTLFFTSSSVIGVCCGTVISPAVGESSGVTVTGTLTSVVDPSGYSITTVTGVFSPSVDVLGISPTVLIVPPLPSGMVTLFLISSSVILLCLGTVIPSVVGALGVTLTGTFTTSVSPFG